MTTIGETIAEAIGYRRPTKGLIGSGLESIIAHQRAAEICAALGIPPDTPTDRLTALQDGELVIRKRTRNEEASGFPRRSPPWSPLGWVVVREAAPAPEGTQP